MVTKKKPKTSKPKHVTETGWAVWWIGSTRSILMSSIRRIQRDAFDDLYNAVGLEFIGRKEARKRGYRCLRTTVIGEL